MSSISGIIKTLQNIMRKDQGVSGDAQRIEQLGWMITLKILDDKDAELELLDDEGKYVSVIPKDLQWRSWARDSEGITGDELKNFIDNKLFPGLQNLDVSDGVETNYPAQFRTTESADLFLLLFIRYLKDGGRAAIVLPDGSLTGDGVKQRIRQEFLEKCNLHTVVRLPNSVFQPYASVATNLLFF